MELAIRLSACIGVIGAILEILLGQPFLFLLVLRDVDTLQLEDDGTGAIVAAGYHNALVVSPPVHDGAALQRCVDVA
jgi:hypothetical protein